MSPEIKEFLPFTVQGFQVRTTNAAEQTPEAKIGGFGGGISAQLGLQLRGYMAFTVNLSPKCGHLRKS